MAAKGPVFGLQAAPRPSWLQDEGPEEEEAQETATQTNGQASSSSSSSGDAARAYVYFTTDLPEPLRLPQEALSVETSVRRSDLSKLVNRLLQEKDPDAWPHPQPLDFLVEGKIFLRGSLGECVPTPSSFTSWRIYYRRSLLDEWPNQWHMKQHGLTAEVSVQLHYQLATRKGEERVLPPARDWISSVAIPRLSGPIVEASYDGHVRLHSAAVLEALSATEGGPVLHDVSLHQGPLAGVACVAVGEGDRRGSLACFAATQGGGLLALSLTESDGSWRDTLCFVGAHGGPATCVATSSDGRMAAVGGREGAITLWDTRDAVAAAATAARAGPRGYKAASGSGIQKRSADPAEQETPQCRALPSPMRLSASPSYQSVTDIKFSGGPLEGHFISASLDGSLRLWGAAGEDEGQWRCEAVPLGVAFCPSDGRLLAVAHEDYRVRLWDVRTPEGDVHAITSSKGEGGSFSLRSAFKGRHARLPGAVSWSSNANLLASVGQDGCVLVQDVRSPAAPLVVFKAEVGGLPVRLLCCDWLGDRAVASGGSDGRVRLHGIVAGAQPSGGEY